MSSVKRSTSRGTVLWCIPRDEATQAFCDRAHVDLHMSTPDEALQVVKEKEFDAIVGVWSEPWRRVLARLERRSAFIHLGYELPQSMVDFVVDGGNGWSAENAAQVLQRLSVVLTPRRIAPRVLDDGATWVHFGAGGERARLLDCSSTGLAFAVTSDVALDQFAEGSLLHDLRFEREGRTLLRGATARVHSLMAHGGSLRIGCEFQHVDSPRYAIVDHRRDDPIRTLALLSRVAKVCKVTLATDHGTTCVMSGARVDAATRRLVFNDASDLRQFEVVDCFAHLDDTRYEWRAAVVNTSPLQLQLPLRVLESLRRHPVRRAPVKGGSLRITNPLSRLTYEGSIIDFTPAGAQLLIDAPDEAFPPGLCLAESFLTVDGVETRVDAEVRHHDARSVGVLFAGVSDADRPLLNKTWVVAGSPHLSDGQSLGFDEVWSFCRSAGLVTAEVAATFDELIPQARVTQAALARDDGQVFNALICRPADVLQGYISAFQAYQHTWYLQHMASQAAGTRVAFDLNRSIAEVCERAPGSKYLQLAYYVDNPWPARVFGGFARRVDPRSAVLKVSEFQRVKNDSSFAQQHSSHCRVAQPADAAEIVALVAQTEPALLLQSMDIDANRLWLGDVKRAYERLGLTRSREAIIYGKEGKCLAVAMCEVSSIGVNFRELASTARLHFSSRLTADERALASNELAVAACRHYRSLGRPFTVLCGAAPIEEGSLWGAPFQLAELTVRKELLRDFKRLLRLSSAMVSRRRAPKPRE